MSTPNDRFAFKVTGMDCPTCSAKVESAVGRIPGLTDIKVNFANQVLSFRAPNSDTGPVESAVRNLGYGFEPLNEPGPRPQHTFIVGGMDCASCADKVATAVGRLPGARDVKVNFSTGVLSIELDPKLTPASDVEHAVRQLGYQIEGRSSAEAERPVEAEQVVWKTPKARLLALLVGLALGAFIAWLAGVPDQWAYLPVALVALMYFGRRAIAAARAGTPFSIEMLLTLATGGAVLIGASSEAATVNILFVIGELLEGLAASRARAGIRSLLGFMPRTATLIDGDDQQQLPVEMVEVGHLVLVRPGDRIPVDGLIIEGSSGIDESAVTGESIPVTKQAGSTVFAGSVNTSGALKVRVTRRTQDNTIHRIIHLVEEAQATKAPTARFIDRFSRVYTPIAVAGAGLVMIVPPLLGEDWLTWIYRGLAVLLVTCPCALVLSTPAAIASALTAGTRRGLLIKGGAALEAIGRTHTVAFDKTGTLTQGRPFVTEVVENGVPPDQVLALAAAVEAGSTHPLARAIVQRARELNIYPPSARDVQAVAGKGMAGTVSGRAILIASPVYARDVGIFLNRSADIERLEQAGNTVVVVAQDQNAVGLIALRDEPRSDANEAVQRLRGLGVRPIMLTGDNRRTANAVAQSLGLEFKAELLPDQKLAEIERLKAVGPVAMIGDGINDAPALAAADVGIAMGGGTDVALETADAGLLHDRVNGVADMIVLSRRTLRNIHQNIAIALGLKAVFLVTTIAGLTGLWPAVLADTGATVLVTLNALRLLRVHKVR